jgi:hypothetical protein
MLKACLINVQQNPFNSTSNSVKILIIQHLRRLVPRAEVCFYQNKCFINETGRSQGCVQKGLQECPYIPVLSPDPLPPTAASLVMKTPENR